MSRRAAARPLAARPLPALALLLAGLLATPPAAAFDGDRAKALVDEIAADEFAGRKSGLESGRKTEDYVAERFEAWGLAPGGTDGGWFQGFDMLTTEERGASITLLDGPYGEVEYVYGDDFALITNSGSGDVTAEVLLVGHGLSDETRDWDDYGDVDVTGKIVVILRGNPDDGYDWSETATRDSTLTEAIERGAVGILFSRAGNAVNGAAIHEGSYFPAVPMAVASKRMLDHLLLNTGWDLKRYQKELKEEPQPLATGKRLRFRTEVSEVREGRARNVVGLVEGADPALRGELVIVGGHMDHTGVNGDGLVYNGANDNGSGTSVVMELARSFAQAETPPARTIAFVTFAAEEQGLLGSKAFAENPSLDLDRAVAMLNFDMTGHGDGKVGIGGGEYYPEVWAAFTAALDSARADSLKSGRAWGGESSDHAPFRNVGIPVWNVWSEGDHRFYHTLQDDAEWVDASVLHSLGRMAEAWIGTLADWPEPLLVEHRNGRSLLYAANQVDFDGALGDAAPSWVRATVDWFDAADFAGAAHVEALADRHARADDDELAIVESFGDVRGKTADGTRATMLGLRGGGVPAARRSLLGTLGTGLARWDGATVTPADSAALAALADAGLVLLVPPAPDLLDALPAGAKRAIRFFPGRGETVAEPDSIPQKGTLFVVAVEGTIAPAELAAVIGPLGTHRVHLDLVPWLAAAGAGAVPEPEITAYLEELQAAGGWDRPRLAGLLGRNLARL